MPLALLFALAALSSTPMPAPDLAKAQPKTSGGIKTAAQSSAPVLDDVSVRLRCIGRADGRVSDCVVLSESRPGYGFGEAAVALMNGTATPPSRDGGRPVDRPFEHTIQFTP
jgi:hypothetical protein